MAEATYYTVMVLKKSSPNNPISPSKLSYLIEVRSMPNYLSWTLYSATIHNEVISDVAEKLLPTPFSG